MGTKCSTAMELNLGVRQGGADDIPAHRDRRGYFDHISNGCELVVLAFIIIAILFGNYLSYSNLMSDVILS